MKADGSMRFLHKLQQLATTTADYLVQSDKLSFSQTTYIVVVVVVATTKLWQNGIYSQRSYRKGSAIIFRVMTDFFFCTFPLDDDDGFLYIVIHIQGVPTAFKLLVYFETPNHYFMGLYDVCFLCGFLYCSFGLDETKQHFLLAHRVSIQIQIRS